MPKQKINISQYSFENAYQQIDKQGVFAVYQNKGLFILFIIITALFNVTIYTTSKSPATTMFAHFMALFNLFLVFELIRKFKKPVIMISKDGISYGKKRTAWRNIDGCYIQTESTEGISLSNEEYVLIIKKNDTNEEIPLKGLTSTPDEIGGAIHFFMIQKGLLNPKDKISIA